MTWVAITWAIFSGCTLLVILLSTRAPELDFDEDALADYVGKREFDGEDAA